MRKAGVMWLLVPKRGRLERMKAIKVEVALGNRREKERRRARKRRNRKPRLQMFLPPRKLPLLPVSQLRTKSSGKLCWRGRHQEHSLVELLGRVLNLHRAKNVHRGGVTRNMERKVKCRMTQVIHVVLELEKGPEHAGRQDSHMVSRGVL
jgi:hypothetical protein